MAKINTRFFPRCSMFNRLQYYLFTTYGLIDDFCFCNNATVTVRYCHFLRIENTVLLFCSNADLHIKMLAHHQPVWIVVDFIANIKWTVEHANIRQHIPIQPQFNWKPNERCIYIQYIQSTHTILQSYAYIVKHELAQTDHTHVRQNTIRESAVSIWVY